MRLINAQTQKLHNFASSAAVPPYAILSHTWGDSEVTFRELRNLSLSVQKTRERIRDKAGYYKIKKCCDQAIADGIQWVWVDTCCIDKRSSAELSEAINSMFTWYQNAKICYAYLDDIDLFDPMRLGGTHPYMDFTTGMSTTSRSSSSNDPGYRRPDTFISEKDLSRARWFTRGWTLQELIAPRNVVFYIKGWNRIGDKLSMTDTLSRITGINRYTLMNPQALSLVSVARRMSWASKRVTTRIEDIAYCLLGIFDVNMPLLYGEGEKAFTRLQEEIMKDSADQTLFAWTPSNTINVQDLDSVRGVSGFGAGLSIFATHPSAFVNAYTNALAIVPTELMGTSQPYMLTNKGVRMEMRMVELELNREISLGILDCEYGHDNLLSIVLRKVGDNQFERAHVGLVKISRQMAMAAHERTVFLAKKVQTTRFFVSRSVHSNGSPEALLQGIEDVSLEEDDDSDRTLNE